MPICLNTVNLEIFARVLFLRNIADQKYNPHGKAKSLFCLLMKVNHTTVRIGLKKDLNIQDCLEKSLKMKFALKSTGKTLKGLEKSLNFTIYRSVQNCL